MIFYFSATGNSKWLAQQLASALSEKLVLMSDISNDDILFQLGKDEKLGFVFPVYSWGIPPIVVEFINKLSFGDTYHRQYLFFACTCGDETGRVPLQFKRIVNQKNWRLSSGFSVIMPNNYVLLPGFDVDDEKLKNQKLTNADNRVLEIIDKIKSGFEDIDCLIGSLSWIKSHLIYPLFVKWGISPSKFFATDKCNGCKKCQKICPVSNITINGYPHWGKNCTSCLACYHICPQRAVQYGKITRRKGQYFHP